MTPFSEADFITMHMPLTTETKHMLNEERMASLKKGVPHHQLRPRRPDR